MTCSQISGVTAPRSRGVSRPALLAMADHVSADALVERQVSIDFDDELTFDQARTASDINLLIAPPLKVSDCSQITDGAAAVVLCS
jgi:acetyl-CoA acetyltransferase